MVLKFHLTFFTNMRIAIIRICQYSFQTARAVFKQIDICFFYILYFI